MLVQVVIFLEQEPLFELGEVYATDGAVETLQALNVDPASLIIRHVLGDWSELPEEDQETNKRAIKQGNMILSSYTLPDEQTKIWIITEWDRSATTILLPEEY